MAEAPPRRTSPAQADRDALTRRLYALKSERSSWVSHWQELSRYLMPRAGRFLTTDRNRGERKHHAIYDNTGTRAVGVLAAGMMAGMTSPARPWMRLATPDPALNLHAPVKAWLADTTTLMLRIFSKSNTYRALHTTYQELGVFGTSAKVVMPSYANVIHLHSLTAGEYAVAVDQFGTVDTLAREFELTVAELVKWFGIDKVSPTVRHLHDTGNLSAWVPVVQIIEPRVDRDPRSARAKDKPWRSVYFEPGAPGEQLLSDSGFDSFPALASRWSVSGGDIYGTSPGMEALGDVKQLQQEQLRKGQAIDYKTKPPLQVPASMKSADVDILPGGISYYDGSQPNGGIRSAFDVNLDLSHLLEDIRDVRDRINGAFFADMFLMLANQAQVGKMTATEVAERHEEKLLMLGPTLERLHSEELQPLIDTTFASMLQAGILPPPPPELEGMELQVEFVSMLAQAQRAIGVNGLDRLVGTIGVLAGIKAEATDKLDADELIERYADMLGADPRVIVPGEAVALVRQQRAQAQQQAAQAALANQAADTAAKLGATPVGAGTALDDVTRAFSGYT